jgi:hypothetical protein
MRGSAGCRCLFTSDLLSKEHALMAETCLLWSVVSEICILYIHCSRSSYVTAAALTLKGFSSNMLSLDLSLSLMQVMQGASFCLSPKSTSILIFTHAAFPLTQDILTICVRPSFIMVPMYWRYSLPSASKRDPEISSDFAYHPDGQHVDGPSTEDQALRPTSEPQASYTWLPPTLGDQIFSFFLA